MGFLKLLPLLILPALFVGATCVTRVDQKGPAGPWVGEVTNASPDPVQDVQVSGRITFPSGTRSFEGELSPRSCRHRWTW